MKFMPLLTRSTIEWCHGLIVVSLRPKVTDLKTAELASIANEELPSPKPGDTLAWGNLSIANDLVRIGDPGSVWIKMSKREDNVPYASLSEGEVKYNRDLKALLMWLSMRAYLLTTHTGNANHVWKENPKSCSSHALLLKEMVALVESI